MTALGDVGTNIEIVPGCGVKVIQVVLAATVDDGDTVTVDLSKFGCTNIHGIQGFSESTTGQVIVTEAPTTAVSSSTLTITVGGSADNRVRTYIVWAY
ncbi:hypothetical protein LCGC14_1316510 [marine sediment metagenome]|uniref:Uncharacterized protein n=1 Tax=marine sediment metagenome TaxID=412755 RepID=A0A0F9KLA3_9ZZZZ